MSTLKNLKTICFAAVLSLGLAACGGGGDDQADDMTPPTPDPALMAAQTAAMEAATAAQTAANAADSTADGVEAIQDALPASYALARAAANDAMDAYMAAKAASAAAAATDDTMEAQRQQGLAEDAQDAAEAAQLDAAKYAGMVQDTHDRDVAQTMEHERIATARERASAAAGEAKKAYEAAKSAVMAAESGQAADQTSYDEAVAQRTAAHEAYMMAMAASQAADGATTAADAEMYAGNAEAQQGLAETARDNAGTYATMVTDADSEATALALAKMKAMEAATEAHEAYMRAKEAAEAVANSETATAQEQADAQTASINAKTAAALAKDASDRAQMAMHSRDAEAEQIRAEGHRNAANTHRDAAVDLQVAAETGDSNADKLQMAQTGAMTAYTEAKRIAGEAKDLADAIATLIDDPTNVARTKAAEEATKAQTASDEAMRLSMLAANTMDHEMAAEYRKKAEEEQGKAQTALNQVTHYHDLAEIGADTATTLQIAATAREAKRFADSAQQHYMDAKGKSDDAADEADAAADAVAKARRARTDVTAAMKAEMAAIAAKNDAATAAAAAKMAAEAAKEAYEAAKVATDIVAAETQREMAETQDGIAEANHMGSDDVVGAGPSYKAAMAARMDAEEAATTHVLGLFLVANAMHLTAEDVDMPNTPANESTTEANEAQDALRVRNRRAINTAIATTAEDSDDAPNSSGTTATEAMVAWAADTPDDPETDADESAPGAFTIALSAGGEDVTTALNFDAIDTPEEPANEGDPTPEQVDERNAFETAGLTGFGRAYQLQMTDNNDRIRALIWTDKAQATAAVTAVSGVDVTNDAVTAEQIVELGTKSGSGYTGVEFDHDTTVQDDPPLMGSLSCPNGETCSIEVVNGDVTAISGYVFTGSRAAVEGKDANPRNDYLAFGIWLRDAGTADVNGAVADNRYTFGAFADGGLPAAQDALAAAKGTATYTGSAAGVHSTANRVDFFYGNANLSADFDDLEVTGRVSHIYAGGERVNDDIVLDLNAEDTANMADGAFTGRSRMGTGRTGDDGNLHYPMEGTWAGNFYNPVAEDADTTVMEAETPPGAAAGTFGVTSTAQGVTESYVGAFGAHKQ